MFKNAGCRLEDQRLMMEDGDAIYMLQDGTITWRLKWRMKMHFHSTETSNGTVNLQKGGVGLGFARLKKMGIEL